MQVAGLRHRCLIEILANITTDNILDHVQAADAVSDNVLMDACLKLWVQPDFWWVPILVCCLSCASSVVWRQAAALTPMHQTKGVV